MAPPLSPTAAPPPPGAPSRRNRVIQWGFTILALAISSAALLIRAWYLLQPSSRFSDSNVYLAMGQGILNGLRPYVDLFEIKPPGMFLLSAASLASFGNAMLGNYLSVGLLLAIPLLTTWWALRSARDGAPGLLLASFTGSALIVVYASVQALPWQTELFGSLVGMLYVLLIARPPLSRLQVLSAGIAMLVSVGLKEPFLLSLLAAALILSKSLGEFLRSFVVPFAIAAIAGISALAALGLLGPYLTLYLPTMAHYSGTSQLPLLARAIQLDRFAAEWMDYSPLLPITLLACVACTCVVGQTAQAPLQTFRRYAFPATRILLAIFCASLSAGIAGTFFTQHFAFPIPAYFAVFLLCLKTLAAHPDHRWAPPVSRGLAALSLVSLATTAIFTDATPTNTRSLHGLIASVEAADAKEQIQRALAAKVDDLLDRCHIDRYFLIHSRIESLYGYTRHSPWNFYFFADFPYEYLVNPDFADKTIERLNRAAIIVADSASIILPASPQGQLLAQAIKTQFTLRPWPCAGSPDLAPYHLFFRKQHGDARASSIPVSQRTFEDYARLFPRLTVLPDYQFDELRYATWERFELPYPVQALHFAVMTHPGLTVYLYNHRSFMYQKIMLAADGQAILSSTLRSLGLDPPLEHALIR